jgi:N-methylhydantoinase A
VRTVSTERGRDVRRFTLLAAGGGGPGHAADIARALGIGMVIIPPHAGVFAALGMLWAPPEQRVSVAVKLGLAREGTTARLAELLEHLALRTAQPAFAGKSTVGEEVDVRYVGQFHQLTVPVIRGGNGAIDVVAIRRTFEQEHERAFGYASPREACEVAAVRVLVRHEAAAMHGLAMRDGTDPRGIAAQTEFREVYYGPRFGVQRAPVLSRAGVSDRPTQGPIVIPEYDTTVIVPPDFRLRREATGALVLERVRVPGA